MSARRWVVQRPSGGQYAPDCFRSEACPPATPGAGELLVETLYLSLDPTHLNWIKLDPDLQFLPIGIGDAMIGTNIGIVRESRHDAFARGDKIIGTWGWEQMTVADAAMVRHAMPEEAMSLPDQLAVVSHVGQAAAGGMLNIGRVQSGDNVLVSAAAGATGSIAAQIAKAEGARVVGIAGGEAKCRYLLDELGLDGAIDYRGPDLAADIAAHFPGGIDLFFDNVGGAVLDAALLNMARGCRIVVCGAIAQYDVAGDSGAGVRNLPMLVFKQARMEGFLAGQFGEAGNTAVIESLLRCYRKGQLKTKTHIVDFDEMPSALSMFLDGSNFGKLIARAR